MFNTNRQTKILTNYNLIQASLASPLQIRSWSQKFFYEDNSFVGEVSSLDTTCIKDVRNFVNEDVINLNADFIKEELDKFLKEEDSTSVEEEKNLVKDDENNFIEEVDNIINEEYFLTSLKKQGLFSEAIFGPTKNWSCLCGKFFTRTKNFSELLFCPLCKVELTHSSVRNYNMGYLTLAYPIINYFFLEKNLNNLQILLQLKLPKVSRSSIIDTIYCKKIVPLNNERNFFEKNTQNNRNNKYIFILSLVSRKRNLNTLFGSEVINRILANICIEEEIQLIRDISKNLISNLKLKQLRFLESFHATKTRPDWILLKILPVIAPNLRPIIPSETGELSLGLNQLYYNIADLNFKLHEKINQNFFFNFEDIQLVKDLQLAVDNLFLNNNPHNFVKNINFNNKPLKSLTTVLEGKKGYFRQYMLGKRVDYSGRSVIVPSPSLAINKCGLPYVMAYKLLEPLIMNQILRNKHAANSTKKIAFIKNVINRYKLITWNFLIQIMNKINIILNRAPTLHKGSLQSFNPIVTLDQAINLHPVVCFSFNADFDGDQLACHIPLSNSSKTESASFISIINNRFTSSNNQLLVKFAQDMANGIYYSTSFTPEFLKIKKKIFSTEIAAISSFFAGQISFHRNILIKISTKKIIELNKYLKFNKILIKKILRTKKKIFLLTNIGILIVSELKMNTYILNNIIKEMNIGQIFYNTFYKNL